MSGSRRVRRRSIAAFSVVAAASSLGLVAFAAPASAGLTTHCVGDAGAVTVPGDLLVPAGKSCVLDGTKVTGEVTVEPGANLVVTGGDFAKSVRVADDGFFDALGTTVRGNVVLADAYGTFLAGGLVHGSVQVTAPAHPERVTYAFASGAHVKGDVTATAGEIFAENSLLDKKVTGTGVSYVDLDGVVVGGDLAVSGAALGSVFCGGEVYGDAVYTTNSGKLQIGADGPVTVCAEASYWGGDLTISGNTAEVRVGNNIVRGDLAGTDNAPAPTGEGNRVRGTVSGQFTQLAASPQTAATAKSADRGAALEAKSDQRRAAARAAVIGTNAF
ncbi:hypothetical protein [Amycolatopsis sp.]|jgi:hypothetical protein|uniref:hypothetical protein n=1 Tax=Amycolatopsis sp. TaxID=37632 RepID=UPI002E01E5FE|nr:hypothetical protein [Amycolatopsis sp.]